MGLPATAARSHGSGGGEHLPPRSGTEIPSSHPELAEGDGIVLFNGQLGSVRGISFSRLKCLATLLGLVQKGRVCELHLAPSSKRNASSCTLNVNTASGAKIFRLLLPQCTPSTLGFSTWTLGDAAKGQSMPAKTPAFGYCTVLS